MRISIVMPAYNAERFLAEAIESVLAQTYTDFELLILDDGSQDRTREIAQNYALRDARVRVITHPNMGIAHTLNKGIALSMGEWVVRMDADDVMMPNRIERQLAFVDAHSELALASSWILHIDSGGKVIAHGRSTLVTHEAIQELFLKNEAIGFCHPAVIFRKSAVEAVGGYRHEFCPAEDIDLWNRLLEGNYKMLVQPEYLLKYRVHGESISSTKARLARQKLRWVKECMLRRRRGQPELSWDQFLGFRRAQSWFARVNAERKDTAKVLHKSAVYQYALHKYYLVVPTVIAAMILQPGYVIKQITSKLSLRHS